MERTRKLLDEIARDQAKARELMEEISALMERIKAKDEQYRAELQARVDA
jgi:hypothetical protein